ncbi:MAG: PilX N-terminal domain-containing pilus assembly protein [Pseudomonadales bacterium]|nr:PilX N-terminal domain-containing pilus assembly protein [Pseudomonadales bacterium]MDG1441214.1 PilX N-terminal domain-containing pilus assembly protein [Pseudomonadales bacterium]
MANIKDQRLTAGIMTRDRQGGVVLFMSLIMLLIITVLGLSSVQTTSMQERMARSSRDVNLAFQAAESAIKDAETIVEEFASLSDFDAADANTNGLYYEAEFDEESNWKTVDWDAADGNYFTASTTVANVASQPKYIVEHVKTVVSDEDRLNLDNVGQDTGSGRAQIFRVTVYATGGTDSARVMIQSTYGKRF